MQRMTAEPSHRGAFCDARNAVPAFLDHQWYMAGWSHEIADDLFSRRIADRPVVLYRAEDGSVVTLLDRCPHRFAPLSLGTRDGDAIVCGYHGLCFDRRGACIRNPYGERIPAGATVEAFVAAERDGIVWIWFGREAMADQDLIPDFSMLAETSFSKTVHGLMPMAAHYECGTDNLMDLSHIEFVHRGTFAGDGVIFAGRHEVTRDGDTLRSNWWMPRVRAPGHTVGVYPRDLNTDHWLDMRWNAPASMHLEIGATPSEDARDNGVIVHQAHILTPETDATTHYFWASTYATPPGVPDMGGQIRELLGTAFAEEDKPMIEAAYANMDGRDFWSLRPLSLGVDQGGARARRLIEELARREAGQPVTA